MRADLQGQLEALAQRARPGLLGVAVLDLRSGRRWEVNADQAYPMMSVFKAPVAATVLSLVDQGKLSMDKGVAITRQDIVGGSAVPSIGARFKGERMTFPLRRLLVASVSESDNTAADALLRVAGGAPAVTAFLREHGLTGMRVDLGEAGIGRIFQQLGPHREPPAAETPQEETRRLQRGYRAYLADPRNRSTPRAAAEFLAKLQRGELLSAASTLELLTLMEEQTVPRRLRLGLPDGVQLADKCGTSYTLDGVTAAFNDIGMLSWPDGHRIVVAAFLTASPASKTERDALFAELARSVAALHPSSGR
ncbi:MAG TPA: class A beta-lactamase [Dyella sp.]|nr:class A beta-lactamase [Dyella sp.]